MSSVPEDFKTKTNENPQELKNTEENYGRNSDHDQKLRRTTSTSRPFKKPVYQPISGTSRYKSARWSFKQYLREQEASVPRSLKNKAFTPGARKKSVDRHYRYEYTPQVDVIEFKPRRRLYLTRSVANFAGIKLPDIPVEELPADYVPLQDTEARDKEDFKPNNYKITAKLPLNKEELAKRIHLGKARTPNTINLKLPIPKKPKVANKTKTSLLTGFTSSQLKK